MLTWSHLKKSWWDVVFWLYLLVLVVLYGTASNPVDADLWHRFALFDYLSKTGHFPQGDTFSYLADYQIIPDHEWGSAFIFYPLYFGAGDAGLVILKLLMLGGTLVLIVRAGWSKHSPTMLEAFFYSLVILALLSSFLSTIRCEVFTHLIFALWVLWFQRERQGTKIHAHWYASTMVVWANLHGGFVVGLVWLMILTVLEFFTDGDWSRRARILGLCLLATLINPFGYELWVGIFRALLISRSAFAEWAPVSWINEYKTYSGYKLLVLWMIPVVIAHIHRRGWRKSDRIAVITLGLFLAASLAQARQTSLFAIVAGGLLPPLFPPETPLREIHAWKPWFHRVGVRAILMILPLVLAFRLLPANQGFHLEYLPDNCPIQAVAYLRGAGTTGRLLVGFNSGSYALWELRGRMRVSMDGRYDLVYKPETFSRVQDFFDGKGHWQEMLVHPAPDAILVNLPDAVYPKMMTEPGWTQVYKDNTQAVFQPVEGSRARESVVTPPPPYGGDYGKTTSMPSGK